MDIDKILAFDNDQIRYPDKALDALIIKLLSVQKDRRVAKKLNNGKRKKRNC